MAKWGEGKKARKSLEIDRTKEENSRNFYSLQNLFLIFKGDPRWIVEERPDATNVNNWHWKESNATGWSKDKLNELLLHFEIADGNLKSEIIEFDKLSGEATANNRKGKLIFFYEWDLVLKWQGKILNDTDGAKYKGKITIPNLSEENDLDEIDITVTIDESNDKSEVLKQFMYNIGRVKIREQVGKYITSLKNDYAKNLILPKKDAQVRRPPTT
jgi:activator of HSP90 ATPase